MALLGVRATANRLGVHENTIRNWVLSGLLRVAQCKPDGTYTKFDEAEVERVLARLQETSEEARRDEPADGAVVSVLIRFRRLPPGMSPNQAVREVATSIQFGKPEVSLHSFRKRP